MKWFTLDAETSIKNKGLGAVGDFAASPFAPKNTIVLLGMAHGASGPVQMSYWPATLLTPDSFREPVLMVGHNIGFDIHYLLKQGLLKEEDFPNLNIWDTQQAEYLLSGMTKTYPSLNDCCVARGLPVKDEKIKEYWDAGVDTELIPKEELEDYLAHDVEMTRTVFLDQWASLQDKPELLELVRIKMADKLSTIWMEWNGMQFDLERAYSTLAELALAKDTKEKALIDAARLLGWPAGLVQFDPAKNEHVSAVLFGGTVSYEYVETLRNLDGTPLLFKTGAKKGTPRTRKCTMQVELIEKFIGASVKKPMKKSGVFSVDDETLSQICDEYFGKAASFAGDMLQWREVQKDIATYYVGYSSLVWPDGKIHPSINHEATRTGRQSCTKPNLQNVTKTDED